MQTQTKVVFSYIVKRMSYETIEDVPYCTYWVFELGINFGDDGAHRLEFREHILRRINLSTHQARHLHKTYRVRTIRQY